MELQPIQIMAENFRISQKKFVKPLAQLQKSYDQLFITNKLNELITKFDKFVQPSSSNDAANYDRDAEERFMEMEFQIQDIIGANDKTRQTKIKAFVANMVRTVMSVGFKQFQMDKFTDKKLRQFFCNNVIANVVKFGSFNKLSQEELQFLDTHLQKKLLSFLKQRYPQNQANEANRKFQSMITPVDNFQSNENDLVYQSGVKFKFKQSGDYSSQIMQFLNYLIGITKITQVKKVQPEKSDSDGVKKEEANNNENADKNKQQEQSKKSKQNPPLTLAQSFFKDMEQFFKKVQDPTWMFYAKDKQFNDADKSQNCANVSLKQINQKNTKIKDQLLQKQKNKQIYKKQVKQYTKYLIGQKLSDNVPLFSKKDIEQKNFKVSNPGLMRILTKWCEQLKNNLEESNINSRDERFRMEDGTQRYIKKQERKDLYLEIKDEEQNLQKFLKEIKANIYFNQQVVLKDSRSIEAFSDFASEFEGTTGYFATFMKKSYENYLISYLNRLIHCILTAQQKFKSKFPKNDHYKVAVNLISFKIGDLLRCKCSSKQTEIVALYNYLVYFCKHNKNKLELVRVKNRLSDGTKDILVNLKYKKTLLVQMQLAIDQQSSKFIKLSDKANHFIYELERATFGPMSEMCNVYTSIDPRYGFFCKKFQAISDERAKQLKKQKLIDYSYLCCQNKQQSQNKKIKSMQNKQNKSDSIKPTNLQLNKKQIKCDQNQQNTLWEYKQFSHPVWCDKCGRFTASLNIKAKHRKCENCKRSICSSCYTRYQFKKDNNIQQYIQFKTLTKDSNKILQKKIIVRNLKSKTGNLQELYIAYFNFKVMIFQCQKDDKGKIKLLKFIMQTKKNKDFDDFFINKYIKFQQDVTDQQKQIIQPLLYSQFLKLLVKNVNKKLRKFFVFEQLPIDEKIAQQIFSQKMETVETINLKNTKLKSIGNIVKAFPNAKVLMLHKNKIDNINGIQVLQNLQQLVLEGNQLKILPQTINQLSNLQIIILSNNKFEIFPQQVCSIPNLKILNIKQNTLKQISPNVKNLKTLQRFRLTSNSIQKIPMQLKYLTNLIQLDLNKNNFTQYPEVLKLMVNLQILYLNQNPISEIPEDAFANLTKIKKISMKQKKQSKIKLKKFPCHLEDKINLESIDLSNNQIETIPSYIFDHSSLQQLILTKNKISKLQLTDNSNNKSKSVLKYLKLNDNLLQQIPKELFTRKKIQVLQLGNNKLTQVPHGLQNLTKLKQIDLSGFGLAQFPDIILNLTKLQVIKLDNNKVEKLPPAFPSKFNGSLLQLSLKKNSFTKFPIELLQCKKLQILRLDKNQLKQIQIKISQLDEKMYEISLSENKFQKFPIQITLCKKLECLDLSNNLIPSIPIQVKNMESLQKLNMLKNQLTDLPQELAFLKNLTEVNVDEKITEEVKQKIIKKSKDLNHRLKHIGLKKQK